MGDWLLNLPIPWMAVVIFAAIYLVTAAIYLIVIVLAVGDRARAFKALSPGMLPPLGIIFGLMVGFVAVQVWNDLIGLRPQSLARQARFEASFSLLTASQKNSGRASALSLTAT
jgi:hypothetical protein